MKTRVLEVLGYSTWGGAAQSVLELASRLPRDRFDVTVVSPRGDAGFPERLAKAGVRWVEASLAGRYDARSFHAILRLIRRERFDVVHTHCRNADLIGGLAARAAGLKGIVAHVRGLLVDGGGRISSHLVDRLHRSYLRHIPARLIAISEAVREQALRVLRLPPSRIELVRHAVDLERFRPLAADERRRVREGVGVAAAQRLVLSIGQLARSKGQDVLLRALARLGDRRLCLALVGDGPERDALRELARELGLERQVVFLGARHDVPGLLAASDLLVHPARWEGFGRVVVEAMAARCPVVASATGGLGEIVVDGESGILVPPDRVELLAWAMARLLDDPCYAASLAARAYERAQRCFDVQRSTQEIAAILEDARAAGKRSCHSVAKVCR
ncbi:MAG: glycosyltransferase [Planctomycetota bacterium]